MRFIVIKCNIMHICIDAHVCGVESSCWLRMRSTLCTVCLPHSTDCLTYCRRVCIVVVVWSIFFKKKREKKISWNVMITHCVKDRQKYKSNHNEAIRRIVNRNRNTTLTTTTTMYCTMCAHVMYAYAHIRFY